MLNKGLILKDIRRNLVFIVIFNIQLFLSIFYLLISISQLSYDFDLNGYLEDIRDKGIITFKSFYKDSNIIEQFDDETQLILGNIYDKKRCAYSYLLSKRAEKYPDKDIYIFVGPVNEVFNIGVSDEGASIDKYYLKAYLGNKISDININDDFNFGYENFENVTFSNVLNENSFFYHRNFKIDLDDSIVICISYEKLSFLFGGIINEELIQNTNFIAPDKEILEKYIQAVNNSKIINVIPYDSYYLYMKNYEFSFYNNLFFFSFFIIFLTFTIFGIVINLINNVDKNFREYSIHMMYGATRLKIILRIILLAFFIILPAIIFFSFFIYISGIFGNLGYLQLCVISAIISILFLSVILLFPLYRVSNKDLTIFYRRDI